MGGQPGVGRGPARRVYTSVPTYRTIDPQLKKMLNLLEEDVPTKPAIIYAEVLDQRLLNARNLVRAIPQVGPLVAGLMGKVKVIGLALTNFHKEKGEATIALEYVSDDDARTSVRTEITPLLNMAKPPVDQVLGTQIVIQADNQGGSDPNNPYFGGPGGPGGVGGPGGLGSPDGEGGKFGPPMPPGGGGGAPGPPGLPPGGGPPMGPGSFGPPGGFGPPGPPGGFPGGTPGSTDTQSTVGLGLADRVVTIAISIHWKEDVFYKEVNPRVQRLAGQLKGRMSVLSGENDWFSLAEGTKRMLSQNQPFPRGTAERNVVEQRYRLPYPPETRVSFLAELLPFLGKRELRAQIDDKKEWYDKDNRAAAEAWVPEFLVPYYPQTSWRATSPHTPETTLGGTNFVAPAGLGLDAARYNPADAEQAKKVGITGYGWGSKPEEIKDGLSNTAYLLQAAPGSGRPWIAGGGATVVGIDDRGDPMRDFTHRRPDGQRGTYIVMADGSVRWVKEGTDPRIFRALITRSGGETIESLDGAAPKVQPQRQFELQGTNLPVKAENPPKAKVAEKKEGKKDNGK
jgi:hypothetical protein